LLASQQLVLCGPSVKTINLPAARASTTGRVYIVKNIGTATVTVNADTLAPDLIDGSLTTDVNQGKAKTLVSDGGGKWYVIATAA
jgi:hypothetical protein